MSVSRFSAIVALAAVAVVLAGCTAGDASRASSGASGVAAAGSGSGSGSATYDFSCFGGTPATTATDPVTIAGTTDELGPSGLNPKSGVAVAIFKTGNTTALATGTSAATTGAFDSGNLVTSATPLDAYVRASFNAFRTSYLYPPNAVHVSIANVPVPMLSNQTFSFLTSPQIANIQQNDTNNGVIIAILSDCMQKLITTGATLSVKQGTAEVGTQYDLGHVSPMAAGTIAIFNVPDGDTTLTAKYGTMTFPVRTVASHKAVNGVGSITATEVLPGPL